MKKYSFNSKLKNLPFLNKWVTQTRIIMAEEWLTEKSMGNRESIKVLEVGSGNRIITKELMLSGFNVTDIDLNNPEARFKMNAMDMHFTDNLFDAVITFEVLEHCNCIKEITRVLKPEGILIATVPRKEMAWLVKILVKLNLIECYELHESFIALKELESSKLRLVHQEKLFLGCTEFGVFKKK